MRVVFEVHAIHPYLKIVAKPGIDGIDRTESEVDFHEIAPSQVWYEVKPFFVKVQEKHCYLLPLDLKGNAPSLVILVGIDLMVQRNH